MFSKKAGIFIDGTKIKQSFELVMCNPASETDCQAVQDLLNCPGTETQTEIKFNYEGQNEEGCPFKEHDQRVINELCNQYI